MRADWRLAAVAAGRGVLAVAFGAFGAHGLESAVLPDRLETWRTGAQYHLVHALAAVVAFGLAAARSASAARWAGRLFLVGIVLFSGSLYALVLLDLPVLGAVAPLGGLSFMGGWAALAVALWRQGATG